MKSNARNTTDQIELAPNIAYQWLEDGQIIAYFVNDHEKESIDALVDFALKTLHEWTIDKPYAALYDVSSAHVKFTPYMRRRLAELDEGRPELTGRVAAVLKDKALSHAIRLFVLLRGKKNREKRIFFTREEGLKWLKEIL